MDGNSRTEETRGLIVLAVAMILVGGLATVMYVKSRNRAAAAHAANEAEKSKQQREIEQKLQEARARELEQTRMEKAATEQRAKLAAEREVREAKWKEMLENKRVFAETQAKKREDEQAAAVKAYNDRLEAAKKAHEVKLAKEKLDKKLKEFAIEEEKTRKEMSNLAKASLWRLARTVRADELRQVTAAMVFLFRIEDDDLTKDRAFAIARSYLGDDAFSRNALIVVLQEGGNFIPVGRTRTLAESYFRFTNLVGRDWHGR